MKMKIIGLVFIALILSFAIIPASAKTIEMQEKPEKEVNTLNMGKMLCVKVTKTNGQPVMGEKVTITTGDDSVSWGWTNSNGWYNGTVLYSVGTTVKVSVRGVTQEHTFTKLDPFHYVMEFTVRSSSKTKTITFQDLPLLKNHPLMYQLLQRILKL